MAGTAKNFDELVSLSKEWVRLTREKGMFEDLKRLLSDLYPDVAHFIYELLQNAQDASKDNKTPTTVRFTLQNNELKFEHSGEKLFDFEDTKAILSIGGTKRDDDTSIGKFGAGFKSVFAYTATPRVYSGEYNFQISDLVVPERIDGIDKDRKADWSIVPVKGKVCIYFPAEKESSNLHFYINAPFASTVARDSVRDCEENALLRRSIGKLIVDSLDDVKNRGLLNMSFLALLPNEEDDLGEYSIIRDAIINAFKTNSLLPTKSGEYAPSSKLYRTSVGKERISNILEDSDLSLLTGKPTPLWVQMPISLLKIRYPI